MLSYGKMARSSAPASKARHVQGAFGTERATSSWQDAQRAKRAQVAAFEARAKAARPTPQSDLLADVYVQALHLAQSEREKATRTQDAQQRMLHNFTADALLQAIAQRAYSGEPKDN